MQGDRGSWQVKAGRAGADNLAVRFEDDRPTQHVRESMVAGQIAELAALPVLVAAALLFHEELRWAYLGGALACVFASLLYFALFLALTRGTADIRAQRRASLVLSCLAVATLGLLELGTSAPLGTFLPLSLVIVSFMSIVGDTAMRVVVGGTAVGAVVVVGWLDGVGGNQLAAETLVYAASVVLITWLTSQAVTSLTRRVATRKSVGSLNQALDHVGGQESKSTVDLIQEILRRGLPLVPTLMSAERITVFARQGDPSRFVSLCTWPENTPEVCADPAARPEVIEAMDTDRVVMGDDLCAIPIGYCSEGELIMVVRRGSDEQIEHRATDAAEAVGAAFLRATSRAMFVSGQRTESPTDPLTGLPSRRILLERIEIEMEHALRSESPLSVAMIDLDHFKEYNDRHGNAAGDAVLRSIAALMVSNIRGQDLVVRYGGEEFCLVMPDTDILGAHHLLDKLRDGGREATSEFGVTLSAGLTSWDGVEDTASMIERADQALCRAKQTGRNRVVSIQSVTEY